MIYGFDPVQMLIMIVGLLLSGGAALLVKLAFARGQRIAVRSGMTGREVAERILADAGVMGVTVQEHQGFLSDHYNPMDRSLHLSPEVYNGSDASAVGVAAHEVGHAIQHARGYAPMWLRSALVPVANIGSMMGPLIIMAGFILMMITHSHTGAGHVVALVGFWLFAGAAAFTLVTVPVEFDASSRARERLTALGITQPGEEDGAVRGVLTAAGLTYVAAALVALMHVLYYAWQLGLIGGGSSRDE